MNKRLVFLMFLVAIALGACSGGGGSGSQSPGGGSSSNPPPASPPSPPPALPPVGTLSCNPCKKIVFTSTRDGNSEIYSIDADGSELTRLTNNDSDDRDPAWSTDGQRIAFTSDRDFDGSGLDWQSHELYVMDANGSNVKRLTFSKSGAWDPAWSPDGTRIAYTTTSNGSANLWEVPAQGGTPKLLLSTPGVDAQPAWSPDGTRLALASDWFAYDFGTDVFLTNADGSGFTAVTDGNIFDQLNYQDPAWSPDGVTIALTQTQEVGVDDYITRLGLIDASGVGLTLLPTPGTSPLDGIAVGTPSWSPDGTTIAYTMCGHFSCQVAWIKADGSARGTIVTEGEDPDWQR